MKGKLVYQKRPGDDTSFFARPFRFVEDTLVLPAGDALEEAVGSVLPADKLKLGCVV